ncbi:MAG: ATP synthase F1 subunit gamma [Bacteroidales bacterium]|nr:ATP synthase F1 subunit gamma [Bacteroidales bacterium]MCF8402879.1 ATP synthase F1 subunit gamma [Bacteroidales bacterium]
MANLKEVRTRIASVKSTQQITSAMKMVAASKLRRAQNAIVQMRPYAAKLKEILQNLSSSLDSQDGGSIYTGQREPKKVLIVTISSNRGLCGAFNANVIKLAEKTIHNKYQEQYNSGNLSMLTIGKKVSEYFGKRNYQILDTNDQIFDELNFENVSKISQKVMDLFAKKEFDRVEIIFNQFKNAATQILVCEQFLPVEKLKVEEGALHVSNVDYIFEPDKAEIVNDLIPKTLKIQFYKALLDSYAAEHGARMTAMHQATDNAQELLKVLNLTYNKARQAAITNEILEIVSGAEALKG